MTGYMNTKLSGPNPAQPGATVEIGIAGSFDFDTDTDFDSDKS